MFYTDLWADLPVGNCAKGAPGELDDLMFESRSPVPGPNNPTAAEAARNYREGKRMCVACPLREACLEQGMRPENLHTYAGVWGGMTAGERMLLAEPLARSKGAQWARYLRDLEDAELLAARKERRRRLKLERRERAAAQRAEGNRVCKRGHDLSVHGRKSFDQSRGWEYVRCVACKRITDRALNRPASALTCSVEGCGVSAYAVGMCQPHYRRELKARKQRQQERRAA